MIGLGDGARAVFGLSKTYRSGAQTYVRPIVKPVAGTVIVAIATDPKVEGQEFSVDATTGIVTFVTPPDVGVLITAGFEFDVPARFDTDAIKTSVASFRVGDIPSVPIVEVRQ